MSKVTFKVSFDIHPGIPATGVEAQIKSVLTEMEANGVPSCYRTPISLNFGRVEDVAVNQNGRGECKLIFKPEYSSFHIRSQEALTVLNEAGFSDVTVDLVRK